MVVFGHADGSATRAGSNSDGMPADQPAITCTAVGSWDPRGSSAPSAIASPRTGRGTDAGRRRPDIRQAAGSPGNLEAPSTSRPGRHRSAPRGSAAFVTPADEELAALVRGPVPPRWEDAFSPLPGVLRRAAPGRRRPRISCRRGLPPHTPGSARSHSLWRRIGSFPHELSNQTARDGRFGNRRSLECGAKTLAPKAAGWA